MKIVQSSNIKDYILKNIDQVKIFIYYANKYGSGLNSDDIYKSLIRNSYMVKNPFRNERSPSMSFVQTVKDKVSKITVTDFGNSFYSGDCFHFAGIALNKSSNNPRHFVKICKDIIENVGEGDITIPYSHLPVYQREDNIILHVTDRTPNHLDFSFWLNRGIKKDTFTQNISPVESFKIIKDGHVIFSYFHARHDPCYSYFLGVMKGLERYKLYLPYRNKGRFITNNTFNIDDLLKMKPSEDVIFIKSIKDRLLLEQILNSLYIDVPVISLSSENVIFSKKEINIINKFYKNKYSLLDNDKAGLDNMQRLKTEYSLHPLYIINSIKEVYPEFIPENVINDSVIIHRDIPKDLSDFCKKYGYEHTINIVKHLISTLL